MTVPGINISNIGDSFELVPPQNYVVGASGLSTNPYLASNPLMALGCLIGGLISKPQPIPVYNPTVEGTNVHNPLLDKITVSTEVPASNNSLLTPIGDTFMRTTPSTTGGYPLTASKNGLIVPFTPLKADIDMTPKSKPATNTTNTQTVNSPGNTQNTSSASSTNTSSTLFDKNVSYQVTKVNNGPMPYMIIGPKDVKPDEKLPVLVHLHGLWEVGTSLDNFNHNYDPQYIVQHWGLTNFRGYIICPLLDKKGKTWTNNQQNVIGVYNHFKSQHGQNINEDKVAISGFSLGAIGALRIAKSNQTVFKKAVLFSPYQVSGKSNIPVRSYVGTSDDTRCRNYQQTLKGEIGQNNCFTINGGHAAVPGGAFAMDSDNNGRSDLVEWLFQ